MSRVTTHVRKGDQVEVISGNHKGKSGAILQVFPKKNQVLIEGVRIISKHRKKSQQNPEGGIEKKEGPVHISNVKVLNAEKAAPKKKAAKKAAKKK